MSNNYKWHIKVIPEDDNYRQLAHGMQKAFDRVDIQVQPVARGWMHAVDTVKNMNLKKYSERRVLLMIDLDGNSERIQEIRKNPYISQFDNRIFIIGSLEESENLNRMMGGGNIERNGEKLGSDCKYWDDRLLIDSRDDACRLKKEMLEYQTHAVR